jgi:hypothetical protein
MRFQFTIAQLLRSTAFFAAAIAMSVVLIRLIVAPNPDRYAQSYIPLGFLFVACSLGGAVGALLGKTPMGVFLGCVTMVALFAALAIAVVCL